MRTFAALYFLPSVQFGFHAKEADTASAPCHVSDDLEM